MKKIEQASFTGERPLFHESGLQLCDVTFSDGESPLKEGSDLHLYHCHFRWKYPLWYCKDVTAEECVLFQAARAGIWYTNGLTMRNCQIEAPKTFRRCEGLELSHLSMPHAEETLWACRKVKLEDVTVCGDYFGMNCTDVTAKNLTVYGNYCFDGLENGVLRDCRILSKDAFWNCRNVTVYDSYVSGEYLGWNAENLTFVNCTLESLQGLCYIQNLKLVNCKLLNTTLAFEYSTVDAEVRSKIDSVLNPEGGRIEADEIGELIVQADRVDPAKTVIVCKRK